MALRLVNWALWVLGAVLATLAWDRHPPLGWHQRVLFWQVGFELPKSLKQERDEARAMVNGQASQRLARAQAQVSDAIGRLAEVHQAEIQVRTRTLREKVVVYVPHETPDGVIGADDVVPLGALKLLDAAAAGSNPEAVSVTAGESYEAATALRFAQLVDNYIVNLGIAHGTRAQLIDFQSWAAEQEALAPPP